jgi:hypothetical protein
VPCQDAHAYRVLPGEAILVAVADGAGTAEHSAKGAQWAVDQVMAAFLGAALPRDEPGWSSLMRGVFARAREAVERLAEVESAELRLFASTLICAVATGELLAVGQIGDGIVVARAPDGSLFAATEPQRGEYANETLFLTMPGALDQIQVKVYPQPVRALAAMSDGLTRLAIVVAENDPHEPFFDPLFRFCAQAEDEFEAREQLAAFLDSDRVCARTDDDKTLVLAVRSD